MSCDLVECRSKLEKLYEENWKKEILRKSKLRTYVQIKNIFGVEKFVKLNIPQQQRSLLAQIRTGSLPLHIETGSYTNKKIEERLCTLCTDMSVETECHFIFHFNLYVTERASLHTLTNISGLDFNEKEKTIGPVSGAC